MKKLKASTMNRYLLMPACIALAVLIGACQSLSGGGLGGDDESEQRVLKVVTSGGFSAAYDTLAPQFQAQTGIRLLTAYGASSGGAPDSIPVRLERGEQFDVIIMSRSSLDHLVDNGAVRRDTRRDLVRSSIGMAVREGAHVPDISTADLFIDTLRGAESFGYSASVSGTYLSTVLLPRLGLWDELEPKSRRIVSERVAAVVARGEVEIGFQQISELVQVKGATLVGPIPPEFQRVTTFSAGISTHTGNVGDAQRLIDYLSSADVAETIAGTGLEPVVLEQ
jgi:molybdate transport system substrate-binding protein